MNVTGRIQALLLSLGCSCAHGPAVVVPNEVESVQSKESLASVSVPVRVTRLENGLRVLSRLRPGTGVVALQAWVHVGSADESADQEGLAHVQEHMVFKGTKAFEQGAIDATVSSLGGEINAWTSFDETVYHLVLPNEAAATGMNLLAELLQRPRLDAQDLAPELEVVAEEIRQDQDSPGRKLSQALFTQAYGAGHPYGRDVAGSLEAVARLDHTKLLTFYDQFYQPERTLLVIDGDLDATVLEQLVAKEWSGWKAKSPQQERLKRPKAASEHTTELLRAQVAQAHFGFAFSVDDLDIAERADLALLAAVLGQGESSRLVRELQYERQLVNGVFAYGFDPAGPGLLVVGGMTDGARLRSALDGVIRSLARVAAFGVTDDAMQRARAQLLAQVTFQNETVQDEASRLAHFELLFGGWQQEVKEREAIRAATSHRLQKLAQRLFGEQRQHLSVVLPEGSLTDFTQETLRAVSRGSWAAVKSETALAQTLPKADDQGRYALRLPSGVQVVLWPDANAEVTAINASWVGGQLLEAAGTSGLHGLLAEVLPQASERFSEVELAQRIDHMGASLSALPGRSSFGLRGEVVHDQFDAFFDVFIDVLKRPRFEPEAIDRERQRVLEVIRSRDDRPAQRAYQMGLRSLFGDHPYGLPLEGEEEPLRHITSDQLSQHYHQHYGSRPPAISIVGRFDAPSVLHRLLATFPLEQDARRPVPLAAEAQSVKPEGEQPRFVELDRSQVQVVRTAPGLAIGDKREPELMILLEVLGGSSGRLFQALREERGLTYGVSANAVIGLRGGAINIHFSTAPERLDESLQELDAALARLIKDGPSTDEVERARRYLKGSRRVSGQTAMSRCQEIALDVVYGLGLGRSEALDQALDKVQPEQVRRLVQELFAPDRVHTTLLGPRPKEQPKAPAVSQF